MSKIPAFALLHFADVTASLRPRLVFHAAFGAEGTVACRAMSQGMSVLISAATLL